MTKLYLQQTLQRHAKDFMDSSNAEELNRLSADMLAAISVCGYPGRSELKIYTIAMPVIERKLNKYRDAALNNVHPEAMQDALEAFDILSNLVMISALPDA